MAPAAPGKQSLELPLQSMIRAIENAPIEVRTGQMADVNMIRELHPHYVILATGTLPLIPSIPGVEGSLTVVDILERGAEVGQRVLVLGGGLVGIEVAEWLAERKVEVVVVELLDDVARDMETITRKMTLKRLESKEISIHTSTRLTRVSNDEAYVCAVSGGDERSLGRFDKVVVAAGNRPEQSLAGVLKEVGIPVALAGDAAQPGQVFDATKSGFEVAIGL